MNATDSLAHRLCDGSARVECELTELGLSLTKSLTLPAYWASARRGTIEAAQRDHDAVHEIDA